MSILLQEHTTAIPLSSYSDFIRFKLYLHMYTNIHTHVAYTYEDIWHKCMYDIYDICIHIHAYTHTHTWVLKSGPSACQAYVLSPSYILSNTHLKRISFSSAGGQIESLFQVGKYHAMKPLLT